MKVAASRMLAGLLALSASQSVAGAGLPDAGTGLKSTWKVELYQGPRAQAEMLVATLPYVCARLSNGEQLQVSDNTLSFSPRLGFEGLDLKGRLSVFLEDLTSTSGRLELDVWDTSGLKAPSPFFKSIFTTSHRLEVGESQVITFSQGDSSILGGAARYFLRLTLEKVESCIDQTSCRGGS